MGEIVVGVDPDSIAHGVAYFKNGKLTTLEMMTTVNLVLSLANESVKPVVSIENVLANNFCYDVELPGHLSARQKSKIKQDRMRKTGRCQQSQFELMQWLDHYEIPYVLHKPQKGNWAKNKPQFEKATGWTGRSNEDTRSAAYFGFLALRK